jgi:glycosyltransferase involved in cell wall biosynthesis
VLPSDAKFMRVQPSRKIVFINQATGYLTIDIINAFARSGHFAAVSLIAGSIRVQDVALSEQVQWSKISLYDRGNPRRKVFSWIKGTIETLYLLLTRYRKYEVFYVTIPPFAYLLSLFLKNRFSVLVFDVYPDVLQIFNVKPSNLIYRLWSRANKALFTRAHRVYTIGAGMARLLSRYTALENITVIPNWSGLTNVTEVLKANNCFLDEQQLHGKFIVQYSGNIGYTHNVEVLIDIASDLREHRDIFFVVIGRGDKLNWIRQLVEERGLDNCRLLPFQPDELLSHTLSAADLGVVLLDDKTAHVSIPSKIYNLQAVGVPILGIADVNSELAVHLSEHQNGRCFAPKDKPAIIDYILKVKDDAAMYQKMKEKSRRAAKSYTIQNAEKYFKMYVGESMEEVTA